MMMMSFQRHVSRALDDEHRVSLGLLDRVEHVFTRGAQSGTASEAELGRLADALARHVQHEIDRHFAFEEQLFVRLEEAGAGDLATLLGEEHQAVRAVVAELQPLARAAAAGALEAEKRAVLRRTVLELVERLHAHIEKETVALLPLLDELIDEDSDRELAMGYATA